MRNLKKNKLCKSHWVHWNLMCPILLCHSSMFDNCSIKKRDNGLCWNLWRVDAFSLYNPFSASQTPNAKILCGIFSENMVEVFTVLQVLALFCLVFNIFNAFHYLPLLLQFFLNLVVEWQKEKYLLVEVNKEAATGTTMIFIWAIQKCTLELLMDLQENLAYTTLIFSIHMTQLPAQQ